MVNVQPTNEENKKVDAKTESTTLNVKSDAIKSNDETLLITIVIQIMKIMQISFCQKVQHLNV